MVTACFRPHPDQQSLLARTTTAQPGAGNEAGMQPNRSKPVGLRLHSVHRVLGSCEAAQCCEWAEALCAPLRGGGLGGGGGLSRFTRR